MRWSPSILVATFLALPLTARADDRSRVELGAGLQVGYSSNPYHEQSRRLDDFDTKNDAGERYEDMEGPSDVFAQPSAEVTWTRKLASKRRLHLSLGAEYTAFARNALASYATLEVGGDVDVTPRDQLGLEIEIVPRRFKKNYYNDVAGDKVFDRAYFWQVAPALTYRRGWTHRWSTELEAEVALRRFDDPFAHRDTTTTTLVLLAAYELSRAVTVKLGPEVAFARVPLHTEFGAEVDRSHDDVGAVGELELDLHQGWSADLELEVKRKRYGSDDPLDDAHHDRHDNVFAAEAAVDKRITHSWSLGVFLEATTSRSNRVNSTVDADDYGYTELVAGVGAQASY